jgi:peptide/nickel transport system substrate-binding protein
MKRILVTIFNIAFLLSLFSAAASPASPLTIALWEAPSEPLHPFLIEGDEAEYIASLLYTPLLALDMHWQWQGRLVAALPELLAPAKLPGSGRKGGPPAVAPGPAQYTLTLRSNLRWGDGTPLTAKDLLFTWQLAQKFSSRSSPAAVYTSIAEMSIDSQNPLQIKFSLGSRQFTLAQFAKAPVLPAHIEGPLWAQSKGDITSYLALSAYRTAASNAGLYSGPFILASDNRPKGMSLLRTTHYSGPTGERNTAREIQLSFVKNDRAPLTSAQLIPASTCRHLDCRQLSAPSFLQREEGIGYEHVDFNLGNPILRDLEVRQALAYAVDRRGLLASLAPRELTAATGFLHPLLQRGEGAKDPYSFDSKKAATLLDKAGWQRESPAAVRRKGRSSLELDLVSIDQPLRRSSAARLITDWRAIGVQVRHVIVSEEQFRERVLRRRDFTAMVLYAWQLPVDGAVSPLFHSKAIPRQSDHFQGQNISGWYRARVDYLCDELDKGPFSAHRHELFAELQRLYIEQLPGLPLFFHEQLLRVSDREN